jgi:hypothetical protein
MKKKSAYALIKASIGADGKLPYNFTLEEKPAPNQVGFVPGAKDGIGVSHSSGGNKKKTVREIACLLKKYFKTGEGQFIDKIEEVLSDCRALSIIDATLERISKDRRNINPNSVVESSLNLVKTSGNIEVIKIGIGLLGLFNLGDCDEAVETVATLALYDDFTLYAVAATSEWTNGNDVIFRIAKNVTGWGKIHAVERLKPENNEIREWILRDGCSNDIMDNYLGLICAVKGDLLSALRQDTLDDKLFDSVSVIIGALIDEGFVNGISEYEHAREALTLYMSHAKRHSKGLHHLWRILNLRDWAKSAEVAVISDYKDEILAQCLEITHKPGWKAMIIEALQQRDGKNFFYAINTATRLDIDESLDTNESLETVVSRELLGAFKDDPLKYYPRITRLFKYPDMAAEIITILETVLPLDEMADGMGDYIFADKLGKEHHCLDFIMPELAAYPLQGIKLIKTALNSRVVRGRNMACRALAGWLKSLGKPLADISPELHCEITRIHAIEVNKHTKDTMKKLLGDGKFNA